MYGFSFQDILDGSDLTTHVLNAARQNAIIEFFWEVSDGGAVLFNVKGPVIN